MMTINIDNPAIESYLKSVARSQRRDTKDIVQGALAMQFGFQELVHLFTAEPSMSEMETEQLAGCQG